MADHAEGTDETSAELGGGAPAALAIALGKAFRGKTGAIDRDVSDFLRKQSHLLDLQAEDLHEQRQLILSRLRLGRWKDRVSLTLQAVTAVLGLAVAFALGAMAWQARQDHGVTIAPFSVPPDLAARGLTGQVVAARVLDRLSELQNQTVSVRPASSYADNWGDDIKVEIPETGVSIGELNRYLRQWLGHEVRVSGEVVRTAAGLSVTARAGGEPGKTFAGAEADTDALIGQAAEAVYAQTQPYRYAVYLASHGRAAEGMARFEQLARRGSPEDQPWAYGGWSAALIQAGDPETAAKVVVEGQRRGLALYDSGALNNRSIAENGLSTFQALPAAQQVLAEVRRTGRGFAGLSHDAALRNIQGIVAARLGDYSSMISLWSGREKLVLEGGRDAQIDNLRARAMIRSHDVTAGLAATPARVRNTALNINLIEAAYWLGDWPRLVAVAEPILAEISARPIGALSSRQAPAFLAIGYARLGRLGEAQALAAKTPLDCEPCVIARAWVAELAGDRAGADRWFAMTEREGPDSPFGDTEWGAALLARGDIEGAIAKLKSAHRKGPHFADPLELWGEALLRKGEYAGAIAKFRSADQYAPRWGRNHLMWGEALMLSGRYREARSQFEAASRLDLNRPDRAALDVLLARTASGRLSGR